MTMLLLHALPADAEEVEMLPASELHLAVLALRDELGRIDTGDNHWLDHLHRRLDAVLFRCLDHLPTGGSSHGQLSMEARGLAMDMRPQMN